MSDRRPEKLWRITATYGPDDDPMMWEEASPADLLAAVIQNLESGTIKGEVVSRGHWAGPGIAVTVAGHGRYIVIGPITTPPSS